MISFDKRVIETTTNPHSPFHVWSLWSSKKAISDKRVVVANVQNMSKTLAIECDTKYGKCRLSLFLCANVL